MLRELATYKLNKIEEKGIWAGNVPVECLGSCSTCGGLGSKENESGFKDAENATAC